MIIFVVINIKNRSQDISQITMQWTFMAVYLIKKYIILTSQTNQSMNTLKVDF